MKLTELDIIKILSQQTDHRRFPWQLANAFVYGWECDFWTMTDKGETREFEIKIDYRDFLNDAKKNKHKSNTGANYFYYVCPDGLISKNEIDNRYGLIYISEIRESLSPVLIKRPKKLHSNNFDKWQLLAIKMYWRFQKLWFEKYAAKEITHTEYFEGFVLSEEPEFRNKIEQSETEITKIPL